MRATTRRAVAGLALAVGLLALGALGVGGAAATAGNLTVSPDPVNASTSVTVAGDADAAGADLTFAIDADGNGTITAAEALGTVTTDGSSGDGNLTVTPGSLVAGEGHYRVYVVEEADGDGVDDTAYPVTDPAAGYDRNVTVEVDDTAPTVSDLAVTNPTGREVRIAFNASEPLGSATIEVAGPAPATLAAVDLVGSGDGPYAYETTYHPTDDGEYAVTVESVADEAGNAVAVDATGSTLAAVAARDEDAVFSGSAAVYLGEEAVDVSPVVGDGPTTFAGVSGAASGTLVRANASALAVTAAAGFRPGGYDTTGDGTTDLRVARPMVGGLSLVLERGDGDVDAAGGFLQAGDAATLTADFGFGAVDDLRVAVIDPSGVDVAPALTDDPTLVSADDAVRLDTAGIDGTPGTYTVRVVAARLDANASTTVRLVERAPSLSLDRTRVVRGRSVIATAFGPPGGTAVVRIPVASLANETTTASAVVHATGDVTNRTTVGDHVVAELALGRDGIARARLSTGPFAPGEGPVTLVDGTIDDSTDPADDRVPLAVDDRRVTLVDPPTTAAVNEELTLRGAAPQLDSVAVYVRLGDTWQPTEGSTPVTATVAGDGTVELTLPVTGELAIPGRYQLAVVGRVEGTPVDADGDGVLDRSELAAAPTHTFVLETGAP